MSTNLIYTLGTLTNWAGWALAIWAALRLVLLLMPGSVSDRGRAFGVFIFAAVLGAIALTVSSRMPGIAGEKPAAGLHVPLIWFVMPLFAWIAAAAFLVAVIRGAQAFIDLSGPRRISLWRSAGISALIFLVFFVLYKRGPEPIQVLRGTVDLKPTTAVAIALLFVAGGAAMKIAAKQAAARNWSRTVLTHLMLVSGSVVFGLPFAFLVITSFKEDRDMSSPNGIVWVPKVQQTAEYWDKKDPLLEGQYRGRTVDGSIIDSKPNGLVEIEIIDPGSMRGLSFVANRSSLKEISKRVPLVTASLNGMKIQGEVVEELLDGKRRVVVTQPPSIAGQEHIYKPSEVEPVREIGLRWQNYTEALAFMPPETLNGLMYLKNTLIIVILTVIGTVLSSSIVAYAFARMKFPGRDLLFALLLATMMLPGAVTLLPKFLIFRSLGWVDTLYPLWVPAFFASAFNVFLLRQFFKSVPVELEDAARIDGCNPARTFWSVMLPLVKPALAFIAIMAFRDAWNNFIEPLIYIASPEKMPISYALQLFQGDRSGEPGLLMAFTTLSMIPVLLLFIFAQRFVVEGVTLSGFGGR